MAEMWDARRPPWARALALTAGGLAALLGFRVLYLAPQELALALVRRQVSILHATVQGDLASQRRVTALRAAIGREERNPARQAVPAREDQAALVGLIGDLAGQAGVRVTQVTFGSRQAASGGVLAGYPVTLAAAGSPQALVRFLAGIETASRLTEVDSVAWSSPGTAAGPSASPAGPWASTTAAGSLAGLLGGLGGGVGGTTGGTGGPSSGATAAPASATDRVLRVSLTVFAAYAPAAAGGSAG